MNKKIVVFTLIFVLLAGWSVFAAGSQEEDAGTEAKKTIKVEAYGWIISKFPLEEVAEDYMKNHPNVTVEVTSMQDKSLDNYLLNWSTGDIDVDLAFGGPAERIAKLAERDLLESWNEFYEGKYSKDNFLTHSVELPKKEGNYYAIPFMEEGMALEANGGMMKDAGLVNSSGEPKSPESLEELYQFAQKLTKGTGDVKEVYGFSWNFTNFAQPQLFTAVNCLGGNPYNDDFTPNLDAPEIVDVFRFIKRVTQDGFGSKGTMTDTNSGRSGLKAETVAIIFEAASRAIEAKEDIGEDAVLLPFPGMEDNGSFIFAHYAYIPKGTEVKDEAWQFMKKAVFSQKFASFGANKYGKLPPLTWMYDGLDADFSQIQEWLAHPGTIGDQPYVEGTKLDTLLFELEQELVTSGLTPEEAAARLVEEGSKLNLNRVSK